MERWGRETEREREREREDGAEKEVAGRGGIHGVGKGE